MMMSDSTPIELLADELDDWLRHRFSYRARTTDLSGNVINARRVRFDLYLRLISPSYENRLWPQHTLVIARIGFSEKHKGHGRALLQFLLSRAERYGYDKIAVESAGGDIGIQSFCAKFFLKLDTSSGCPFNWIASVEHVSHELFKDEA